MRMDDWPKILERREALGPSAFVFGSASGQYQPNIQTAWETLKLLANGYQPRKGAEGAPWNRERLKEIDLRLARPAPRGGVSVARGWG